jgi:hypothetical protein
MALHLAMLALVGATNAISLDTLPVLALVLRVLHLVMASLVAATNAISLDTLPMPALVLQEHLAMLALVAATNAISLDTLPMRALVWVLCPSNRGIGAVLHLEDMVGIPTSGLRITEVMSW